MKKNMLLVFALFAIIIILTGCGKKGIVGTWEYQTGGFTYTFNSDGTGYYDVAGSKMNFTYSTGEENKLSITYDGNTAAFETTYKIDGSTLIIKDSLGEDVIYKRK